jgi:serine/threonine protein kinase
LAKDNPAKYFALKKIFASQGKHDSGFPLTALREIKILQILEHPNIVKLHKVISSKSNQKIRKFGPKFHLKKIAPERKN